MNTALFDNAAAALPNICFQQPPACGLILGSGWSTALSKIKPLARLPYAAITGMGNSTVAGHNGEMLIFECHGIRVAAFLGRHHWYEGAGWEPVILPVELLRRMGAKNLLITNAAGGINPALKTGELVIIRDHINTTGLNPLIGPVVPTWGTRFPDQSCIYKPHLRELLRQAALKLKITLAEGVYAFTSGPSYETPSEIRAYANWGADMVGMSTVPEAIVANAVGISVAGLSCITNMAAGISVPHLSHADVLQQTQVVTPLLAALLDSFLQDLAHTLTAKAAPPPNNHSHS